jgi:hypothetical protein
MPVVRCPACATEVPAGAKFCPRCGVPAPDLGRGDEEDDAEDQVDSPAAPVVNLGTLPSPIPIAGILFLVALVVGPAAIVAGMVTGTPLLLYAGIAVAAAVVILLLLGQVL